MLEAANGSINIVDIAKVFSALFAGASVFVAVFVYRKSSERDFFSQIRKSLIKHRCLIEEAEESFDEIALVEIGAKISDELRSLCPSDYSAKQIHQFFYDDKSANFIRQAIYIGLEKSRTVGNTKQIAKELWQLNSEFSEPFPVTKVTLSILSAHYLAVVNTLSSGDVIDSIFEGVRQAEPQEDDDYPPQHLVFHEIGVYITELLINISNKHLDEFMKLSNELSEIVCECYEKKSDRDLRRLSNAEKKAHPRIVEKMDSITIDEKALFEFLKFYKTNMDSNKWDRVVEVKTLLEANFAKLGQK